MLTQSLSAATGFDADHSHCASSQKRVKQPDRIRAAADAGHQTIRQASFRFENLRASFPADHAFENRAPSTDKDADRARCRASNKCRATFVTQSRSASLIASFKVRDAGFHLAHFGAEQLHAKNIQRLPTHVFRAHIDNAFEPEQRAHRRGRHAVLARAGFGDDAALAHAPRQQDLAERVVDFVRAGVEQIFALEIDARAAACSVRRARRSGVGRPA